MFTRQLTSLVIVLASSLYNSSSAFRCQSYQTPLQESPWLIWMLEKFRMWPYAHKRTEIDLSDNVLIYLIPLYVHYMQCSGNVGFLESQKHLVLIDDKTFLFKTCFLTAQNNNRKLSQQQKQIPEGQLRKVNLFLKLLLGITETEKPCKITCLVTLFINCQLRVINWHLLNNWSMIFVHAAFPSYRSLKNNYGPTGIILTQIIYRIQPWRIIYTYCM